jgi:alpha-1,4-digalacturonate transport system substrate-binding protein
MPVRHASPLRSSMPDMSRRTLLSAAGGVGAALALAACGSGGGGSSSGGSAKNVTFWISTSAAQLAGWQKLAAAYKKQAGVTVSFANIPYSSYQTKLRDAAQANALPDVADVPALDPIWVNSLQDLKSITSNNVNTNFVATGSGGKVLSIPSDVTASGMFINKTRFDKAGVSYPTSPQSTWTWTEFIAAANKVRSATGAKYSLVFDSSPSRLRAMVYEMGGQYMHADAKGTFSYDSATEKAVEYFVSLNNDLVIPKSVWTSGQDPNAMFSSGDVAAYWSGVWQVSAFAESITNFEWASAATPAQPVQASDVNSGGMMVAYTGTGKDFMSFVYEPANYRTLVEVSGFLPVENNLDPVYPFKSSAAQAAFKLYNEEIPLYAPISGYFNTAQTDWVLKGKSITTDPSVTEIGKAINGQQPVSTALKNIAAGYNEQVGGVL